MVLGSPQRLEAAIVGKPRKSQQVALHLLHRNIGEKRSIVRETANFMFSAFPVPVLLLSFQADDEGVLHRAGVVDDDVLQS